MKKSGVALLATIISIAVLLLVSGGFFTIMASNTGLIKSSGESLQAQYFAQLEADIIKMLSYDEVDNITQDTWQEFDIDNSWQYKVNVGPEQNVGDSDNTMKIASISVRKSGDTIDRFALDVPLSSQSNSSKFIPDYTKGKRINSGFVAPYNGVVVALTGANCNGDPAYGSAYLKINGVQVIYWKYEQHGENKVTNSVFVRKGDLVEYGDYVSWWGYRPVSWIVSFYPCK